MSAEAVNLSSRLPRRRAVFAWDMHYACNYRCPYCFYTVAGWEELAKKCRYHSPEARTAGWGRVHARYGRCQLRITAGEPFTYPRFVDVVAAVTRDHDVQITSNCSLPEAAAAFAERIDPARAELDCTFHPLAADFEAFAGVVRLLRERGFVANVCYLAYPEQLSGMREFKRRFADHGIHMNLAIFWGRCRGRDYPHAYTEEEKALIRGVIGHDTGPETVGLEPMAINGKVCGAGQCYAVVQADGRVYRCGQRCHEAESLGSVFDPDFGLHPEALPCRADYCRCKEYQSAWRPEEARALDQQGVIGEGAG